MSLERWMSRARRALSGHGSVTSSPIPPYGGRGEYARQDKHPTTRSGRPTRISCAAASICSIPRGLGVFVIPAGFPDRLDQPPAAREGCCCVTTSRSRFACRVRAPPARTCFRVRTMSSTYSSGAPAAASSGRSTPATASSSRATILKSTPRTSSAPRSRRRRARSVTATPSLATSPASPPSPRGRSARAARSPTCRPSRSRRSRPLRATWARTRATPVTTCARRWTSAAASTATSRSSPPRTRGRSACGPSCPRRCRTSSARRPLRPTTATRGAGPSCAPWPSAARSRSACWPPTRRPASSRQPSPRRRTSSRSFAPSRATCSPRPSTSTARGAA
jgi:hypothetical protein